MSSPYRTIKVVFLLIDVIFSATIQAQEREQRPDTLAAWEAYQRADTLFRSGNYNSAITHFYNAKEYYKKERAWRGYMDATNRIGRSFIEMAQYDSARYYLDHALVFAKEKNLSSDYWLGVGYANKTLLLQELGEYEEATRLGKKALKTWDKAKIVENQGRADVFNSLGILYQRMSKYESSMKFYKKGLRTMLLLHGEDHGDVAAFYVNIGVLYEILGDYDEALKYQEKALSIFTKRLGVQHPHVGAVYHGMGVVSKKRGDLVTSIQYYERALNIFLKSLGETHPNVAITYNSLGLLFIDKGDYDKAEECFEKALNIEAAVSGSGHMRLGSCYRNLGMIYHQKRDYDRALEYYEKAAHIWRNIFGEHHEKLTVIYDNLGALCSNRGEYERAIGYYEKALTIGLELFGPKHPELVYIYDNLGVVIHNTRNYSKAIEYYEKALAIQLQTLGEQTDEAASIYYNMGVTYKEQGHLDKAIKIQDKVLSRFHQSFGDRHPVASRAYRELGDIYERLGDYAMAMGHYQKALIALLPDSEEADWRVNPDLDGRVLSKTDLLRALEAKAQVLVTYHQEVSCDVKDLQLAVETYLKAVSLIGDIQRDHTYEGSRLSLQERVRSVYEGAAMALKLLYECTHDDALLGQLFILSEQSKASVLRGSLQQVRAMRFARIPDSLVQQDVDLRRDIAYYDTEIGKRISEKAGYDTTLVRKFESRLFELRRGHERLTEILETKHPDYHRVKYSQEVVLVDELQHLLDDRTAQIAFFQADGQLSAFTITSKGFQVTHTPLPTDFEVLVDGYRRSLSDQDYLSQSVRDSRREYLYTAHALYRLLLEEPLSQLPESIERLVIVPDGQLATLPFETLLTRAVNNTQEIPPGDPVLFKDLDYLLLDYDVSYAYSATLWREQQDLMRAREAAPRSFAGFAPTYEGLAMAETDTVGSPMVTRLLRSGNKDLPGALEEVQRVSGLVSGDSWLGEQATETRFKQVAKDYRVLHLSMHGLLDDGDPSLSKLLFSPLGDEEEDGFLHASEIYATPMVAEMAVLSACDTGYGTLHHGEGVMSLSRAFTYAGCPSVVGSLWKAQDKATSQLMVEFYGQLDAGLEKDAALRQAKLSYLQNALGNELHPSHWAAFVVMGDASSIDIGDKVEWHAILLASLGVLLMALSFLWLRFKRYSSRPHH